MINSRAMNSGTIEMGGVMHTDLSGISHTDLVGDVPIGPCKGIIEQPPFVGGIPHPFVGDIQQPPCRGWIDQTGHSDIPHF